MADSGSQKSRSRAKVRVTGVVARPRDDAAADFLSRIDAARKSRLWPSFMESTNGGGSLEHVQGFDVDRAMTAGFRSGRLTEAAFVGYSPQVNVASGLMDLVDGKADGKVENVIGTDDRVRIRTTAMVPWRSMCHLVVKYDDGRIGAGTGWFAGPRTVITAAHVLHDGKARRSPEHIQVIPGRNGHEAPFGFHVACGYEVSARWKRHADPEADFGAVFIDGQDPAVARSAADGSKLGYFGFKEFSDAESRMMLVNNAGYPVEPNKELGTLWFNGGRIADVTPRFLTYMIDTEGGQSGSPIFHFNKRTHERLVVAIHTTGWFPNRGVRISGAVFDQLLDWVAKPLKEA
jgi:glutamyl endopeptidase